MKVSRYNIEIQRDGNRYIYNSLTGAFAKINDEYYKVYQVYKNSSNEEINEENDKIVNDLKKGGFLIDDNYDELGYLNFVQKHIRFKHDSLSLTVMPTKQCNFRCFYCYEKHKDIYFTQEIKERLINFISTSVEKNKYKYLHITWYGGEPLLMFDDILDLSQQIVNICEKNDVSYNAGMVTNGYLLTKERAEKLKEIAKIESMQITIDGDKESHDKYRVLENGEGTFDVIIENIKNACENIQISIRCNLTEENYNKAFGLINFLKNNNLFDKVNLYFYPVRAFKETECENLNCCLSFKKFAQIEIELLKYLTDKGVNLNILIPQPKYIPCGAIVVNSFVVGPDGYIYKCWNRIEQEHAVGDLWNGLYVKDEKFLKWVNWELPSTCYSCNVLPLCQCSCPDEKFYEFECFHLKYNLIDRLGLLLDKKCEIQVKK